MIRISGRGSRLSVHCFDLVVCDLPFSFADEFSRDPLSFAPIGDDDQHQPIEPISDISIDRVSRSMFK